VRQCATSDRLSPRLFAYYLRYGPWVGQLRADAQGTTNRQRVTAADILALMAPCPTAEEQGRVLARLDAQRGIADRALVLLAEASNLNWLDDEIFAVAPSDVLAISFAPLVTDVSDYVDPGEQPDTLWKVYGVTNEGGIRLGEVKAGRDFKAGRKYKRLVAGAIAYNPQRVNVGSVGLVADTDDESILSPYYPHFACGADLDPAFAYYLIKSPYFRRLIDETAIGAVRHELFLSLFVGIEVPIPRLERQREIVRIIETQLMAYDHVRMIHDQAEGTMRRIVRDLFGLDHAPSGAASDPSDDGTAGQDRDSIGRTTTHAFA